MPCNEHLPHRTWVGNKPWQSHDTATHRHNSKAWAARWCRKHVGADGRLDKTSKEDASDVYFGPSWEIRNTVRYRAPRYNAFRCLHPFCCQRSLDTPADSPHPLLATTTAPSGAPPRLAPHP